MCTGCCVGPCACISVVTVCAYLRGGVRVSVCTRDVVYVLVVVFVFV